jgi:hypothetical protein
LARQQAAKAKRAIDAPFVLKTTPSGPDETFHPSQIVGNFGHLARAVEEARDNRRFSSGGPAARAPMLD